MTRRAAVGPVKLAFKPVEMGQPVAGDLIAQIIDETGKSIKIKQVASDLSGRKNAATGKFSLWAWAITSV